jgi:hypothetical protein
MSQCAQFRGVMHGNQSFGQRLRAANRFQMLMPIVMIRNNVSPGIAKVSAIQAHPFSSSPTAALTAASEPPLVAEALSSGPSDRSAA